MHVSGLSIRYKVQISGIVVRYRYYVQLSGTGIRYRYQVSQMFYTSRDIPDPMFLFLVTRVLVSVSVVVGEVLNKVITHTVAEIWFELGSNLSRIYCFGNNFVSPPCDHSHTSTR